MKKRRTEEQIVQILWAADAAPTKTETCRKYGISEWTYYYDRTETKMMLKMLVVLDEYTRESYRIRM